MSQQIFEDTVNLNLWGFWECPKCGEELSDPNSIVNTTCHKGHSVFLSYADVEGDQREATFKGNIKL